ncbi:MAG: hypothetical protein GDA36_09400 [Rhodobacteraceae bacterium]|nr:hypothetical protein [Paracoccaceae bacterium]
MTEMHSINGLLAKALFVLALATLSLFPSEARSELDWRKYFMYLLSDRKDELDPEVGHIRVGAGYEVFVPIADPLNHNVLPKKIILPAGTNLLLFDRFQNRTRRQRQLALTSFGVFAYVPMSVIESGWFRDTQNNSQADETHIKLVRRVEIPLSPKLIAVLVPGTVIPQESDRTGFEDDADSWIINLDSSIVDEIRDEFEKRVSISYAAAQLFDSDSNDTMYDHFTRAFSNGLYGIKKGCGPSLSNTSTLEAEIGAGLGITINDLNTRFGAGIDISAARETVERFGEETILHRFYYRRIKKANTYQFTERTDNCNEPDQKFTTYSILLPGGTEIQIDFGFLGGALVLKDKKGFRHLPIVVSCSDEFQMVIDGLVERGVPEIDAPFFASLISQWNFKQIGECRR